MFKEGQTEKGQKPGCKQSAQIGVYSVYHWLSTKKPVTTMLT